jgi:O-antigen/teichoic acid export membrane protein
VGYFSRALGFVGIFDRMVLQAVIPVALPSFSKSIRDGGSLQNDFVLSTTMMMGIAWPFAVVLYFLAPNFIEILYGDQWLECIPLAKIMVLGFAVNIPGYLTGTLLISAGCVRDYFRLALVVQPIRLLLLVFAVPYGLECITIAMVLGAAISTIASIYVVHLRLDLENCVFLKQVGINASVAFMCALPFFLTPYTINGNELGEKFAAMFLAILIWLFLVFKIRHPLAKELLTLVKNVRLTGGRIIK